MDRLIEMRSIEALLLEVAVRKRNKLSLKRLETRLTQKLARLFIRQSIRFRSQYQTRFQESLIDDIDKIFNDTSVSKDIETVLDEFIRKALLIGGRQLIDQFDIDAVFSLKNPRAVEYLKNIELTVKGIDDHSKEVLRGIIVRGIETGQSYTAIARLIRQQFTDFSTKRTKLIAVTELGNAYQEGNLIAAGNLSKAGLKIEKYWLTRGDTKVEQDCKDNQKEGWIPHDQAFQSGVQRPLDHPRCRCVLLFRRVK